MASDTFRVGKRAEKNLSKILDYYTDIDEKLANRFFQEIDKCFEYIKDYPYMFRKSECVLPKYSLMGFIM